MPFGGFLMKIWGIVNRLFKFGQTNQQFSLGDQSWNRPPIQKKPEDSLSKSLAKNRARLEEIFVLPANRDIIVREFQIPIIKKTALIIYIDGLADRNTQNFAILQPLMILNDRPMSINDPVATIYEKLLPGNQILKSNKVIETVNGVLDGSTVLLIDGSDEALIVETKGWEHRAVEKPNAEHVVRGPQEGFTETFRVNTAGVRRYLKDPKLVTEIFRVGRRSNTLVGVMYIKDIANPKLVEEVKYRIQSIAGTTDYISETGALEEFIEDHPRALVPQMLSTERPDRLAAYIREGHVGVVMANSPYSLAIPVTFTIFLHAAEDYYLRWPFGNFLRFIRASSIFIALLLPAVYIAVVNYHQEMIPTDLLLAITASRESVPFPSIVEILFMEFSFELIREAGIRIPSVIGPTIGIVGALILGQAAVAASIVSPILIIVIAITALGSFVVPNYNASFTIRLLRFGFTLLAGFLGFFGIAFGIFIMTLHVATLTSFGVPFLTPIAPYRPKNKDRVIRPPVYDQRYRPVYLRPLDWIRQNKIARPWDHPREASEEDKEGAE
jgi:spore germination protein KA